ncbi:MAG: SDR family NAD(P)-dependent oxidoreductase [Acidimicrobiales bacterium]
MGDSRRIVITGGGSGIGAAAAELLTAQGAAVAILDRVAGGPAGLPCIVADVRDAAAVDAAIAEAAAALGGLTGLVNNAGVGALKPLETYTDAEWSLLIGVNLTGAFNATRAAVPHIRAAGGGTIVNVSSLSALIPTRGEGPYSVAKAGLLALTKSSALEFAPDIRVNAVSPGFVETPLTVPLLGLDGMRTILESGTPLGRIGTGSEVAEAIAFLCGDVSAFITGHNLVIDGGASLIHAQADPALKQLLEMLATVAP